MNPEVFEASTFEVGGQHGNDAMSDDEKDVEKDVETSSENNVQDSGENNEEDEYEFVSYNDSK